MGISLSCAAPGQTATYDNARAGTSRAAKMRATVGGVLDRAFAVAVAPPVISDELPLAAELLAALDAEGRTPLHCAAGAGYGRCWGSARSASSSRTRSAGASSSRW